MRVLRELLAAAVAALLLWSPAAIAKQADGKRQLRIVVYPKHPARQRSGPYGFLPGYRQPPPLTEWRDRSPLHGGGYPRYEPRYWSGGEWRYGWGYPRYYGGRWNGGSFGPCWTQTPIGPMWNCGM